MTLIGLHKIQSLSTSSMSRWIRWQTLITLRGDHSLRCVWLHLRVITHSLWVIGFSISSKLRNKHILNEFLDWFFTLIAIEICITVIRWCNSVLNRVRWANLFIKEPKFIRVRSRCIRLRIWISKNTAGLVSYLVRWVVSLSATSTMESI